MSKFLENVLIPDRLGQLQEFASFCKQCSFFNRNLFRQSFNLLLHLSFNLHYFLPLEGSFGTIKLSLSVDNKRKEMFYVNEIIKSNKMT